MNTSDLLVLRSSSARPDLQSHLSIRWRPVRRSDVGSAHTAAVLRPSRFEDSGRSADSTLSFCRAPGAVEPFALVVRGSITVLAALYTTGLIVSLVLL